MVCPECATRRVAEGHETCWPCHFRSLGWTFKGAIAGDWNSQTIRERQAEAMSNPNVEPI